MTVVIVSQVKIVHDHMCRYVSNACACGQCCKSLWLVLSFQMLLPCQPSHCLDHVTDHCILAVILLPTRVLLLCLVGTWLFDFLLTFCLFCFHCVCVFS